MKLLKMFIGLSLIYCASAASFAALTEETCENNENEELTYWLYDGFPCGNTCSNYKIPCGIMLPMVLVWSPHCVCKKGFSRLANGTCVDLHHPECEELWRPSVEQCLLRGNEVHDFGSACQTTCADLASDIPRACVMSIVEDCYCPEGMVRYVENGPCVVKENCPRYNYVRPSQ